MQAGITGRIINIHLAVIVRNGAVGKHNVGHIAHALPAAGGNQEAGRLGNDLPRFLEVGHKNIDDIPQPCRRVTHAVGNVQPALVGLDGGRTLAVLGFGDGVIAAGGGDDFLIHDGVGNVAAKPKADAAAGAGVDKIVHRAGKEGVFAVDKLRQQVYIALLRAALGHKVGQALPCFQVLGAHNTGGCHGGAEVRVGGILALGAEDAVNIAVLMLGQAHIVDVGFLRAGIGQLNGLVPEAEPLHGGVALCHAEKALTVVALDAGYQIVFAVQLDGARVEHGIDAQTLDKIGVGLWVKVKAPFQRDHLAGQHGVLPAVINAVVKILVNGVAAGQ